MNVRNIGPLLLTIAFCLSSTSGYAQSDSLTIARSRIVRWVANIEVANDIISEQGDKLDGATDAIVNLQAANRLAEVTISDALAHNNKLRGDLDTCEDERSALTNKIRKLTGWASVGKFALVVGVALTVLVAVR
jgi:hypothetical protein